MRSTYSARIFSSTRRNRSRPNRAVLLACELVVEERLRRLRVVGLGGDRSLGLDQDGLVRDDVVELLAGGDGADRLVLIGEERVRPCRR